ncbi:MAG: M20/M25/M40 family metallo-hydrolase [Planctomycetota bacterium]|jgi:hypothetical protein
MRRQTILMLALVAALASGEEARLAPAITAAELIGHVRRLASDAWAGRGTGTDGERQATEYIAAHFARLGLTPAGEKGGFFQDVRVPDRVHVDPTCRLDLRGADATLELDKDWRPFSLSTSGQVEGDVVFAGYGIRARELAYDDYAGLDVGGKIVVVFRHVPHGTPAWRAPQALRKHAPFVAKLNHAIKGGAIGLIVVNDPFHFPADAGGGGRRRSRPDRVQRGNLGAGPRRIAFAHLTLAAARRVFPALLGATPEALEAAIHAGPAPAPASRPGSARLRLDLKVQPTFVTGRNVCALLPAGAPDGRDEIVVVGAHHDHLGRRGAFGSLARSREERLQIHNGADDNASGTAGVLEVAAYLAARSDQLRRSVVFLTFTAEERGLLGSRYFVEHPTVPLAKVVAMLNLDMIGRLDGRAAFVGGVETSPAFRPILERRAAEVEQKVIFGDGGRAPSDNASFYAKGLPVLFFFTGMHRDYHRPSDDADKIDLTGMERMARLAARTAEDLAQLEARPKFQRADQGGAGPPRPILGISAGVDPRGVAIAVVMPRSPAAQAGLEDGDVILAIGGRKTPNLAALRDVMRPRKIGEKVKVKVLRGDEEIEVEVTLGRG